MRGGDWASSGGSASISDYDSDGDVYMAYEQLSYEIPQPKRLSSLEKLPCEIIESIATYLPDDASFKAFLSSCAITMSALLPLDSGVWRKRFLNQYDYPFVRESTEFSIAYRLRQLTVGKTMLLKFQQPGKWEAIVLQVMAEMIHESYNSSPRDPAPCKSKNVAWFSRRPFGNTALHQFLASPYVDVSASPKFREMFMAVRLTLSHVFLNVQVSHMMNLADLENYDICLIYLHDTAFRTICKFEPALNIMTVDTQDLVHILNFWHYHLNVYGHYGSMAFGLANKRRIPQPWSAPLRQFNISNTSTKWIGHYTCMHDHGKQDGKITKKELIETQSCAEVWEVIDPLVLDFSIVQSRNIRKWWPSIFESIPAFKDTPKDGRRYIQGMAYFVSVDGRTGPTRRKSTTSDANMLQNDNPNALPTMRLRGYVHPLPRQAGIPGWSRMVFVLYKVHHWHTIGALWTFFGHMNASLRTAMLPLDDFQELELLHDMYRQHQEHLHQQQLDQLAGIAGPIPAPPIKKEDMDTLIKRTNILLSKIHLTPSQLARIERKIYGSSGLEWSDIDYAYAYEAVLTPGGKIMLGRFWLLDLFALHVHAVDPEVNEVGDVVGGVEIGVSRRDVGSFVFWGEN